MGFILVERRNQQELSNQVKITIVMSTFHFNSDNALSPQGTIGKAGSPGEVGLQGLPVSMTFDLTLTGVLIGCACVNLLCLLYYNPDVK